MCARVCMCVCVCVYVCVCWISEEMLKALKRLWGKDGECVIEQEKNSISISELNVLF